jgi:hypothetical protein
MSAILGRCLLLSKAHTNQQLLLADVGPILQFYMFYYFLVKSNMPFLSFFSSYNYCLIGANRRHHLIRRKISPALFF